MEYRVKELTKKAGLTLEGLATALGCSRQNLTKTLSNNPTIGTLEKIAGVLGVEVVDLFAVRGDFIAFVREDGETRTFTAFDELKDYVNREQ